VDTSKIDVIEIALNQKIESLNSYRNNTEQIIAKLFKQSDTDNSGDISEKEFVDLLTTQLNFPGYDDEVKALFRRFDTDRNGTLDITEFTNGLLRKPGCRATSCIGRLREVLRARGGGVSSLQSMGRQFRIMDKHGKGSVNIEDMTKSFDDFCRGFGLNFSRMEYQELFAFFDKDKDGAISYNEFVLGIRGPMSDFRKELVLKAFRVLDKEGKGEVTLKDLGAIYDVSQHPLVLSGKITKEQALKLFLQNWDINRDGKITAQEFLDQYEWVSSSIDRDDYFELMIRNAWHISGGTGVAQNTANLRVLVTFTDASQKVVEVENDFGLDKTDNAKLREALEKQGVKNIQKVALVANV